MYFKLFIEFSTPLPGRSLRRWIVRISTANLYSMHIRAKWFQQLDYADLSKAKIKSNKDFFNGLEFAKSANLSLIIITLKNPIEKRNI